MATLITTLLPQPAYGLPADAVHAELSLLTRRASALLQLGLPPIDRGGPMSGIAREVDRALAALTLAQELTPPPDLAPARVQVLEVGDLTVCTRTRTATTDTTPIPLTRCEFDLLTVLARDPAAVLTKAELLREVWGYRYPVRTRTVDTHASRLRRKLTAAIPRSWVVNHWGVGYSLTHPTPGSGR